VGERKRSSPAVSRDYKPTVDATVRAVELLLRSNQGTKRAVHPDGPNHAEDQTNDSTATRQYTR
jgi:hypothetical protein